MNSSMLEICLNSPLPLDFAGYVTVCVQLYCVSFHCLSLHVSAYIAIFRCLGYFYFHMYEEICFAAFFFLPFFSSWSHSARFRLWSGLNMKYYYLCYFWYCYICVFFTYFCFSVLFSFVNFIASCVCVCLLENLFMELRIVSCLQTKRRKDRETTERKEKRTENRN
jgi:hypothetical protein